jgi:hypothetical protein
LLGLSGFEEVTSANLAEWCTKYATKGSEVEDKYNHYFYTEMVLSRVQTFGNGGTQLHMRDALLEKSAPEYDFIVQTPPGTSIADFSVVPGAKVQLVGRGFFRKKVFNSKTGKNDEKPWPSIDIVGMRQFLDLKKYEVGKILAGVGLKVDLTKDGE